MMRRLRPRGDDGVYAILYAMLMLVMLGMAALVVDIGALRQNRRQTRLASDAAAVAGARHLDTRSGTADPRLACTEAWSYLATNLGFTAPASNGCGVFPTTVTACPLTTSTATATVGAYTARITWPVHDTSPLMTQPNVESEVAVTQPIDPAVDGDDPCNRIGVTVEQREPPKFASIFGTGTVPTSVTSVARSTQKPGEDGPIAALNVLEPKDCAAVRLEGQGKIEVGAVFERPGIIAVESSGRQNGGSCPNSAPWVIDVSMASGGGYIRADGPGAGGLGQGVISSYALNPDPKGNPAGAFNPATVPPGSTLLRPRPTLMGQQFGVTPITNRYDCTTGNDCPHIDSTPAYLSELKGAYGGAGLPNPYVLGAPPYNGVAFKTASVANGIPTWKGCTVGQFDVVYVPAGNWYVDCPELRVQGVLVFAGGHVVTRGGVNVSSGCFAMNVPLVGIASCPTLNAAGDVIPAATTEAILYLRSGNLSKGAQASLFTERTFVYLDSGNIAFGGGSGALYLTNPAPAATCENACADSRFGKLALWSNGTGTQEMGGQSGTTLRGILFTPKSTFSYSGQGAQVQTSAQFWALKLLVKGQGTLRIAPDPTASEPRPELGTALLR